MLLTLPDPRLHEVARPVGDLDRDIDGTIAALREELDRTRGLGISAPQMGVLLQVVVVRHENRDVVLINPRLISSSGTQLGWEGCLSVPHLVGWVERPERVVVDALDAAGMKQRHEGRGLAARVMAHELDHLRGRIYLDGLPSDRIVDTRAHPTPPEFPG